MKACITYKSDLKKFQSIKGANNPQVALEKTLFSDVGDI